MSIMVKVVKNRWREDKGVRVTTQEVVVMAAKEVFTFEPITEGVFPERVVGTTIRVQPGVCDSQEGMTVDDLIEQL